MHDVSEISGFINKLIGNYQNVSKLWLIGSRLDENTHWKTSPPSDWDLVIFTNKATMNSMKNDLTLRNTHIDLIVVFDNSERYVRLRKGKNDREKDWKDFEWVEEENGNEATYTAKDIQGQQRAFATMIWDRHNL